MRAIVRNTHGPARPRRPRPRAASVAAALALSASAGGALVAGMASPAAAGTTGVIRYVATGGSDVTGAAPNDCASPAAPCATLAHAIVEAGTGDTVSIGPGTFFEANLAVSKSLTIEGAGASATTIDASRSTALSSPVLSVDAGVPVTVTDLTLANGANEFAGGGIADTSSGAQLTVSGVDFVGDHSLIDGGALYEVGSTVSITDSLFLDDSTQGNGGAVYAFDGTVALQGSVAASDTATGAGGGVEALGGLLTTSATTFQHDTAATGGGIDLGVDSNLVGAQGNATTTTFYADSASVGGGAVTVGASSSAFGLYHDSFQANTAATGDAVDVAAGTAAFQASVLDDALGAAGECALGAGQQATTAFVDFGADLADDATCSLTGSGSRQNVTPQQLGLVGPPGPNGGFAGTLRVTASSAAFDVAPATDCAGNDERGVPFLQGAAGSCDAGAYQFAPPVIASVSPASGLPTGGEAVTLVGRGFSAVTGAAVGAGNAPIEPGRSDTSVVVDVPPGPAGTATLSLFSPDGTGSSSFAYVAPTLQLSTRPSPPLAGSVTLTETVSPAAEAAGTVAFSVDGAPVPGCSAVPVAGDSASSAATLAAGTRQIGAALTEAGATYPAPVTALVVGGGAGTGAPPTTTPPVTTTPTGPVTTTPTGPVTSAGSGTAARRAVVRLRGFSGPRLGVESIAVACAGAPCHGVVTVSALRHLKRRGRVVASAVVLARGAFAVRAGRATTVHLRLGATAARLAGGRRGGRVPAKITVRDADGSAASTRASL